MKNKGFYSIIILITYIWTGMLLGISFIEAPLKFRAPNVTLAIGLSIEILKLFLLLLLGVRTFNESLKRETL